MGDDDHRALGRAQAIDALGDDLERVDVQPGVGLVQHCEPGFQQRHLQDFVALLLAAGEALIDRAVEEFLLHADRLHLGLHPREEVHRVVLGQAAVAAHRVDRSLEEVGVGHAGNLDRVLEGEEEPGAGAFLGRQGEQVGTVPVHAAVGHGEGVAPGEHLGQRALARTVGAHDGVHLAAAHLQVQTLEDGLAVDGRVQVVDLQHVFSPDFNSISRLRPLHDKRAATGSAVGAAPAASLSCG